MINRQRDTTLDTKTYRWIGVLLFGLCILVSKKCSLIWPLQWTEWIGYYVLGNIIYENYNSTESFHRNRNVFIGFIVIAYVIQIMYWFCYDRNAELLIIPSSFSISVMVGSIIQFVGFAGLSEYRAIKPITYISKYSMEIYLLHPLFVEVIMQLGGRVIKQFPSGWLIPVLAGFITLLCIWLVDFYEKSIKGCLKMDHN